MTQKKRTLKAITKQVLNHPFFPLLFISEAVKIGALNGFTHNFVVMVGLSVVSTILWVLSDVIDVDLDAEGIIG